MEKFCKYLEYQIETDIIGWELEKTILSNSYHNRKTFYYPCSYLFLFELEMTKKKNHALCVPVNDDCDYDG